MLQMRDDSSFGHQVEVGMVWNSHFLSLFTGEAIRTGWWIEFQVGVRASGQGLQVF